MENVIIIENILREEMGLSDHQLEKLYRLRFDFSLQLGRDPPGLKGISLNIPEET
jgi:hypothetical protein